MPAWERPEHTDGYEGFYHLVGLSGSVENAEISYIIRDHIREKFEAKKQFMMKVVELLTQKYGEGVLTLTLKDQYYNMREMVEPHPGGKGHYRIGKGLQAEGRTGTDKGIAGPW